MRGKIVFYWLIGIVIAAIVMVAAFYFDESVRNFMAQHQNHAMHDFMRKVSRFGDWPEHFALGLALAGFAWWRGNRKWTRIFLSMLIAPVLKTGRPKGLVSSNLTPSAILLRACASQDWQRSFARSRMPSEASAKEGRQCITFTSLKVSLRKVSATWE